MQFLALPRFVRRRRTAAQMAWGLLRALGLLRHLLTKRLIPSEAAWRALLLAAGQIKATATDLTVREFARDVARALFREMQAFSIAIGPQTFALWSLAVAGDEDEGDATEDAAFGAARARQFLADFAALPLPDMPPADAMRRVQQMKRELEADAADSKWLQGVLA